jgi:hypothetical protein
MTSRDTCWDKYAAHLKIWYVNTYKGHFGATKAINDGRLIRKIALKKQDNLSYENLKDGGVSEHAAKSVMLYISNTKDSYMGRCVTDTSGFDPEVECMGDSDCPQGYRCRGRGKDSVCVREGEPPEDNRLPPFGMPDVGMPEIGGIKRSLQTTAVVVMIFFALLIYIVFVKGKGASGVTVGQVG